MDRCSARAAVELIKIVLGGFVGVQLLVQEVLTEGHTNTKTHSDLSSSKTGNVF